MNVKQEVKKAKKGDHEAFIRLVLEIKLKMYGLAFSILGRDEDCADAIQETILKAYKSLHTLRKPEFFNTWIFRILINECHQVLRNKKRLVPVDNLDEIDKPRPPTDYDAVDIRDAVEQLEEQQQIVIQLFYFQDMPLLAVAELLGITENAVKGRLFRARRQLLQILGDTPERKVAHESK
ncbi:sigma-70 family RNA polymerase sigma factor [Paenibacillus azoreducens]|uniref:RNA polymerase subunit sigma-24 n=1 Tax=Paenibacillus azoreducens TaxID=116718 RepID=A0A919YG27_9BACL|nr:sigma-70 family RNA polymerase sigma factor [Paenibacillus azoreducens]GIO48648.1 RNA polymerase subunit sigma-24 [Paenibacillus azoreducens]